MCWSTQYLTHTQKGNCCCLRPWVEWGLKLYEVFRYSVYAAVSYKHVVLSLMSRARSLSLPPSSHELPLAISLTLSFSLLLSLALWISLSLDSVCVHWATSIWGLKLLTVRGYRFAFSNQPEPNAQASHTSSSRPHTLVTAGSLRLHTLVAWELFRNSFNTSFTEILLALLLDLLLCYVLILLFRINLKATHSPPIPITIIYR